MGGEPLLNPKLKDFIQITRSIFKDAMLKVVTNGLLIDKVDESLFDVMRENHCEFDISLYKPTNKMKHKIQAICDLYGVEYSISSLISEFFKVEDISGKQNKNNSFDLCMSKRCTFLRNGKISVCGIPQLIGTLNDAFGTEIYPSEQDIIDLYDKSLSGKDLIDRLNHPMDICRYCSDHVQKFKWSAGGADAKLSDWVIEDKYVPASLGDAYE